VVPSSVLQAVAVTLEPMARRLGTSIGCCLLVAATLASSGGASGHPATPPQRPPVVVQVRGDGFHWGDAAVGAAATLGLTLAAGGFVVFIRSGPPPRPEGERHA
jgi:hypothetical protein